MDIKRLLDKQEKVWNTVKDIEYGWAIGILCVAMERKCAQCGVEIMELAGNIGEIMKQVNEQEGEVDGWQD